MLFNLKSCRLLLALTAMGALTQESRGGCNCSVPPSPSASPGMAPMGAWSGSPGYGNVPGVMPVSAYGGPQTAWSGGPGYGNMPGSMPATAYGGSSMGQWSGGPGYGNVPGNMPSTAYGGSSMGQSSGGPGYGNVPGSMPSMAYGGSPMGQWSGAAGYGVSPGSPAASAYGMTAFQNDDFTSGGPHWAPGGYEARIGSPAYYHDPAGGQYVVTGNPYYDHFGPGFHRYSLHGHYRFPYYNYRAPWYFPGKSVYNRNTNFAW